MFKSTIINGKHLFSSPTHKRSRLGLYENIMTKATALNKLTKGNLLIEPII